MTPTILVTGIGGNVGQGIIRNIRSRMRDVRIIGTDVRAYSGGNHLCDQAYTLPRADSPEYVPRLKVLIDRTATDLLIPSTDLECYVLSQVPDITSKAIVSRFDTVHLFYDKLATCKRLNSMGLRFAETYLPSYTDCPLADIIVKPRRGGASRGVAINPASVKGYDDSFVVQKLYRGRELTASFYVTQSNKLHGLIVLERDLENGMTGACEVIRTHDAWFTHYCEHLISEIDVRGPCNVQCIDNGAGDIVPFEFNCRYSGTNSIRAQFGFEDVWYGIQEYLLRDAPAVPVIQDGCAVRMSVDIIYKGRTLENIAGATFETF